MRYKTFSQRMGLEPMEKSIQIDSIDVRLRNMLWNTYSNNYLKPVSSMYNIREEFLDSIWVGLFGNTSDTNSGSWTSFNKMAKEIIITHAWNEVYTFIEYSVQFLSQKYDVSDIEREFNIMLENEMSGYRFIGHLLSPITSSIEIDEIQESLHAAMSFTALLPCNVHLTSALEKLSDRANPDFRNSIKESISAIESLAKIISKNEKDTLAGALDKIKGKLKIHSALEQGFKKIYGYTSDSSGIRHALTDADDCTFEDAKYMLVSCSAFLNYLIAKAEKAEINLQ